MVKVDYTDVDTGKIEKSGLYRARVHEAELTKSQKGELMFRLRLVCPDMDNRPLGTDVMMLEGRGKNIGTKKIQALLGGPQEDVEAKDFLGKEFWAHFLVEQYRNEYGTGKRMNIDIDQNRETCGIFLENPEDETPF